MKQVPLVVAALAMSAGAAFAATPSNSSTMNQPATQAHRSDWRANQETKALNLLEAQGFSTFRDFRPAANDQYAANVMQHGRLTTVYVNPQDGQITRG
jgi:hypothetical protein